LHVLVEKPLALNLEDAQRMLNASKRNKRMLKVGFNRRFNRNYLKLKSKISLIPCNDILSVFSVLIINPFDWGAVTSFHGRDSEGGGVIDDVASHQIDLITWLIEDEVAFVKAKLTGTIRENGFENMQYEIKFRNGLIAKCEAGHASKYSENIEIQLENRKFLVYPTGHLELGRLPIKLAHLFCSLKAYLHYSICKLIGKPSVTITSIENQLSSFASALRGEKGEFLGADARSGIDTQQIMQACRKSNQSGGTWIAVNL
jgi:predicted dehydrogenase